MNPIPRPALNKLESLEELNRFLAIKTDDGTGIWCLCEKGKSDFIGICGIFRKGEQDCEIGYQLREKFWRIGYGIEIAKGLIEYGFNVINLDIIKADVSLENHRSVKLLDQLFRVEKEFFNEEDNCTDRRYVITKEEWGEKSYDK